MSTEIKVAHTAGPWAQAHHKGDLYVRGADALESVVCQIRIYHGAESYESAANARLIAAAPDLLAACKLALGAFERNDAIDWGEIEAAIQKAEGT